MSEVILFSDVTQASEEFGYSRYVAPYVLASKLRSAGFSCVVIDQFTHLEMLDEILDAAIGPETIFIGFSSTFLSIKSTPNEKNRYGREYNTPHLWCDSHEQLSQFILNIRQKLKKKNSVAPIVIGGAKSLSSIQETQTSSLFDYFVIGKGESFIVNLVQQIKNNDPIIFKVYNGVRYLHESHYNLTTDSVQTLSWGSEDAILPGESLPLEIAKGCLYNCKFCHFDKQGSVRQELQALKDQLISNYEKLGTTVYHFCDDCFNDTRDKVEKICELFLTLPFKIEWVSYARVDVAVKFPQTLELMVESGARGLFWGLETFDHKIGRKIGKGTDPNLVKEMLLSLKKNHGHRVLSTGSFIVGLPGETEESIWNTNEWIISSKALDDICYFPLGIRPYSEKLDKAVIDFADYSRNPEKYGFKKISFSPYYWEHETMNSDRAVVLKYELVMNLKKNGLLTTFAQSIFQYPHFRSLGLNHAEIVDLYKKHHWHDSRFFEIQKLESEWRKSYETMLLKRLKTQNPSVNTISLTNYN